MGTTSRTSHAVLVAVVLFFFAHLPGSSLASRPFVTEDAGVAGKGVFQVELSWDHLKWRNNDREHVLTLVPIFGFSDEVELSFEIPIMSHDHVGRDGNTGIGDINFVTKYLLIDERDILPAFALKTVVKMATGSVEGGLGSGAIDYGVVAVASKQLGDVLLHAMFGYTFIGKNGDANVRDIVLHGIAAEYAITEHAHLVAEIAGNRHPDRMVDEHPNAALFGAAFTFTEHLMVDASMKLGLNSVALDWNTAFGMTLSL